MRWTPEQLQEALARGTVRVAGQAAPSVCPPSKHPEPEQRANKFGAVRTEGPDPAGGTRAYDSKAGAALARRLELEKRAGAIVDWFEEVSVPMGISETGAKVRYRADAMILGGETDDGWLKVRFVDRKRGNHDTDTSRAKRAALRARGLNVEIITE